MQYNYDPYVNRSAIIFHFDWCIIISRRFIDDLCPRSCIFRIKNTLILTIILLYIGVFFSS